MRRAAGIAAILLTVLAMILPMSMAVADDTTPVEPTASTIALSTIGSKDVDKNRTQQSFQFENADWTGYYIRPGVKARFRLTLDTDAAHPNVTWVHRQVGRVDENNYAQVRAVDGGILKTGVNDIEYDTTGRRVGQTLYIRNDGGDKATVTVESLPASDGHPSLGRYPVYEHDPDHPERFWTYVQSLREYVAKGVDVNVGDMNANPDLGMDATAITVGRMVYEMRAARLADALKDITTERQAVEWVDNVYTVSTDRLDYFDKVLGFDATDADTRQHPTRMKVVLELTQNLTNPSTMFAWFTMYHLPESTFPGVAASLDGAHGWGNDHEYGHMLDIAPLTRAEETNNLISMWGRRLVGVDKLESGTPFTTTVYHDGVRSGQKNIDQYLDAKLRDPDMKNPYGDIWFDVTVKFNVLHWFDDHDYTDYDYGNGSGYTREQANQVSKYGGLGAVYRRVRANPGLYRNVGGYDDAAARAYSDALGYDMSEVMGRYGMTVTDATRTYTARYPKLPNRIEYYSIDSDVAGLNGAKPYDKTTPAPTVTTSRPSRDRLTITASYPNGSAEKKTTMGYALYADGRQVAWSRTGVFTVDTGTHLPEWTVEAYDDRANPSPKATVKTGRDVTVVVRTSDGSDPSKATVTITPDDPDAKESTNHPGKDGTLILKDLKPATITVSLDGYKAYPTKAHADTLDGVDRPIMFTLAPDRGKTKTTPRPAVTGTTGKDGNLAFTITPDQPDDAVYYTMDGSEPDAADGVRWDGTPIPITGSPVTVKAIAYRAGMLPSPIVESTFTDTRKVTVWNVVWAPDYGGAAGGRSKDFGVGDHTQSELDFLADQVRSMRIPDGLKVTYWQNPDRTGASRTYTATVNFVNGYDPIPSKSMRVETVHAGKPEGAGTVVFQPGAADATGVMNPVERYRDVSMTAPDVAYRRAGYEPTGWKGSDGRVYGPGDMLPDGDLTLTAVWKQSDPDPTPAPGHGMLPSTGGSGVIMPIPAGMLLTLAGFMLIRRQVRR
ncbi:FN3 associated domain-containing protein [Bifidobacterium felsineum]|uniref:FN3 associated domain-containing protein n=1 Tax=Bifidobacterium felsineum TaxID=2045440 RepID=UPI001BDD8A2A|nr:FN3 associated domain-containing protein [Bifidobacterium felsineum]MBT1164551.1 chitobiase/beta-hexosaminidase C-terminal domain-containing protein [Bifidobacterium felsineum]